jgi:ribonuclease E
VNAFLGVDQANLLVEHHSDGTDVLEHYRVNAAIRDALKPRVDLPSGGYVIIEPTEALTVIDVNSGSFTRSASSRETVLWTNCEAAAEIARQLKLRNIGGVVIIDFIDMESRRDQLMLLEHFTQSVQDDAARPQIAQLTELGLVELTRKRQGQNIYELFGRACPSCGGLGHVAVLPGKDTLQPLATVTGLVRSAASARAEVPSPNGAEPATGRRRGGRGGRGGRGAVEAIETAPAATFFPDIQDAAVPAATTESGHGGPAAADSSAGSNLNRRQDPDLVAVPMDSDQELVYGWMGLSPALLLDPPPTGENLVVRVVRPGEDGDAVLEAARQQLAASGSRRRRRGGRGGSGGESPAPSVRTIGEAPALSRDDDAQATLVEITPLPDAFGEPDEAPMTTVIESSVMHIPVSQVSSPESRRVGRSQPRARRQELREDGGGSAVAVAEAPLEAPPVPLLEESESDASGEPRRRRRRSSASV